MAKEILSLPADDAPEPILAPESGRVDFIPPENEQNPVEEAEKEPDFSPIPLPIQPQESKSTKNLQELSDFFQKSSVPSAEFQQSDPSEAPIPQEIPAPVFAEIPKLAETLSQGPAEIPNASTSSVGDVSGIPTPSVSSGTASELPVSSGIAGQAGPIPVPGASSQAATLPIPAPTTPSGGSVAPIPSPMAEVSGNLQAIPNASESPTTSQAEIQTAEQSSPPSFAKIPVAGNVSSGLAPIPAPMAAPLPASQPIPSPIEPVSHPQRDSSSIATPAAEPASFSPIPSPTVDEPPSFSVPGPSPAPQVFGNSEEFGPRSEDTAKPSQIPSGQDVVEAGKALIPSPMALESFSFAALPSATAPIALRQPEASPVASEGRVEPAASVIHQPNVSVPSFAEIPTASETPSDSVSPIPSPMATVGERTSIPVPVEAPSFAHADLPQSESAGSVASEIPSVTDGADSSASPIPSPMAMVGEHASIPVPAVKNATASAEIPVAKNVGKLQPSDMPAALVSAGEKARVPTLETYESGKFSEIPKADMIGGDTSPVPIASPSNGSDHAVIPHAEASVGEQSSIPHAEAQVGREPQPLPRAEAVRGDHATIPEPGRMPGSWESEMPKADPQAGSVASIPTADKTALPQFELPSPSPDYSARPANLPFAHEPSIFSHSPQPIADEREPYSSVSLPSAEISSSARGGDVPATPGVLLPQQAGLPPAPDPTPRQDPESPAYVPTPVVTGRKMPAPGRGVSRSPSLMPSAAESSPIGQAEMPAFSGEVETPSFTSISTPAGIGNGSDRQLDALLNAIKDLTQVMKDANHTQKKPGMEKTIPGLRNDGTFIPAGPRGLGNYRPASPVVPSSTVGAMPGLF